MRARKRFGQHFLHDPAVIERIAAAIDAQPGECIVEVGPGRGALTRRLLASGCRTLDAIEIDRDLAAELAARFSAEQSADHAAEHTSHVAGPRFELHRADALQFDFRALAAARGGRLRLVGNLPYNISTPLLFHLLASAEALLDMHVMLQKEVAARIVAHPGTAEYGRLTVMLAPRVRAERLFEIGPGAFQPPPRVWSAVLRLSVLREPAFAVAPAYGRLVRTAFAHRRKTLRNALRGLLTAAQIEACGLDPATRPDKLSAAEFNSLAAAVQEAAPAAPSPADGGIG